MQQGQVIRALLDSAENRRHARPGGGLSFLVTLLLGFGATLFIISRAWLNTPPPESLLDRIVEEQTTTRDSSVHPSQPSTMNDHDTTDDHEERRNESSSLGAPVVPVVPVVPVAPVAPPPVRPESIEPPPTTEMHDEPPEEEIDEPTSDVSPPSIDWEPLDGDSEAPLPPGPPPTEAEANDGHVEEWFLRGRALRFGLGTDPDPEASIIWYRRAAEAGHPTAQNSLGYLLFLGKGCIPDIDRAVHWFRKATAHHDRVATYNLASCYRWGLGVPRDEERARALFSLAAERGFEAALEVLRELES